MIIFLYNYLFNSYKLLNVLIHILKIQGDYKYTVVDEEHDREELDKHNLIEEDMFDEMVDIDGKVNGKKIALIILKTRVGKLIRMHIA